MIVSATFMLFILNGIDSVRTRSATIGPGGFNSIMQLDHGLDDYSNALRKYQLRVDSEEEQRWKKEYQNEFNILWGNLTYFDLRFLEIGSTESLLVNFKHDAQQFLSKTESYMATDYSLTAEDVSSILTELSVLQIQVHEMGREYFQSSIVYRDTWVTNLGNLYKLLLFFSAVSLTTACLLVAFLIRSNHKKNALIQEADDARTELSSTVAELRSGRLEQRAKDSFIAAASHDLRQPLHALGLFLGSLEAHVVDEKGRSTLNEAIECSTNLGSLFNSLLDLSRLDAGVVSVEYEHFRIQKLVAMLQLEFQAKTSQSSVDIQMQVQDAIVRTDPILLSRIVRNLIENALIHSNADTITVSCTKKHNIVQLEVKDNGVGISQAEQQRVFTEYYQINNRSTGTGKGLGLGLSIVKRLAELLEMRMVLQSEIGVSTSFTMNIPVGDENLIEASYVPEKVVPNALQSTGRTIAVVDDDEKICAAMSSMIQSIGLNAVTATTADTLIDTLIELDLTPSLIVADYRLEKGRTGDQAIVQLCRALNINVPGLLITGDTAPIHVAEAAKSGFEILHKPVQPAQLSEKIRIILAEQINNSVQTNTDTALTVAN